MTDGRLSGKVAIVTGAASGIGLAIVKRFLDEGALVVGADRDEPGLAKSGWAGNERARTTVAEVSSQADAEATVALAVREFGTLDILVNSAGIVRHAELFDLSLRGVGRGATGERHRDLPLQPGGVPGDDRASFANGHDEEHRSISPRSRRSR